MHKNNALRRQGLAQTGGAKGADGFGEGCQTSRPMVGMERARGAVGGATDPLLVCHFFGTLFLRH